MRAAAGSVPAVRPELGPKSSRALRCLFQAAPISTASTLSIGDRGEEEKEAEEEEVLASVASCDRTQRLFGFKPELAKVMSHQGPPPEPDPLQQCTGGIQHTGCTVHDIKPLHKIELGLMAHGFCSNTPEIN
ncbi:hypothetical protein TURU_081387 [Turdus rufiventris]|nr:hypothetical protein TURU_081387 [Turdus rufiventris]